MGQHWSRYIEDFENEDNRDYVRSKKHRKKTKLINFRSY